MSRTLWMLGITLICVQAANAFDWPQYLGPNGDRSSNETSWDQSWDVQDPAILWRDRIGLGYSSVIVNATRAFTMGYDRRTGEDIVYAKDALTGENLWTYRYPCNPYSNLHKGGPGASPLYHEGVVYTLSKDAHLFAFDAQSGSVLWSHRLQDLLNTEPDYFGFTNSPLLSHDKLIVDVGTVAAFDLKSGEVIWQTSPHNHQYAPPGYFVQDGRTILTSMNTDGLLLIDAQTGEELGRFPIRLGRRNAFCNTPLYQDKTLLVSGNDTHGLIHLDVSDPSNIQENWSRRDVENLFNQPALFQGNLLVHSRNQQLHCIDYDSGETRWTSDELQDGPFIIAGDKLLAISGVGEILLGAISNQGLEIEGRKQIFGGNCWTPPVLANGVIYCRNENGDLVALDVRI